MDQTPLSFPDRLAEAVARAGGPTVVGIDPDFDRLPADLRAKAQRTGRAADQLDAVFSFCCQVLQAVAPTAAAVKFQSAYFERFHAEGVDAYFSLVHEARTLGLLTIGDVKRGDIGPTAAAYAAAHLIEPPGQGPADGEQIPLGGQTRLATDPDLTGETRRQVLAEPDRAAPDAITVNPYLGLDGVAPFLATAAETAKGVFVLVRTSNPSAAQLQDFTDASGKKLYEHLADLVESWSADPKLLGHCGYSLLGAVVGATWPQQARQLRVRMPHCLFLVPGYGAQGASAADCMACFKPDGTGAIVNASRSILYAFDRPAYRDRFGADWPAAVAAAAADFRDELAAAVEAHREAGG